MQSLLADFLDRQPDVRLAILLGPAAAARLYPTVDVDLAMQFDEPPSASRKHNLITTIALLTGRPVDLVNLRAAGQPLVGEILSGKRISGKAQQMTPVALRNELERADFWPLIDRFLAQRRHTWMKV